jgi:hypothetical protein
MRLVALMVLLSIAAVGEDDKDKPRFAPGPASSYPGHQTIENITIAALPYITEEQSKIAFGKAFPSKFGVLPVLVILENGTGKALRLDIEAEFIDPGNRHVEATPAEDVIYIGSGVKRPKLPGQTPYPNPFPHGPKKGPLNVSEITTRAFSAKMLPAGESASGFFYFQTPHMPGSKIYLTGFKDATTGKDYFYFEVPIDAPK